MGIFNNFNSYNHTAQLPTCFIYLFLSPLFYLVYLEVCPFCLSFQKSVLSFIDLSYCFSLLFHWSFSSLYYLVLVSFFPDSLRCIIRLFTCDLSFSNVDIAL